VLWPEEDCLFVRAFDLDAMRLDAWIVLERLMDNSPIERVQWFEFDNVPPASHFLCRIFGFPHQGFSCLSAVATNIYHDLGHGRILLI
jgi:hypothetical protein